MLIEDHHQGEGGGPEGTAKRLKREKADKEALNAVDGQIREQEKAAKDLETKAADIDAAVFDLKAVNPNAVTKVDDRTAQQIIGSIEQQGRIVSEALARLKVKLASGGNVDTI